MSSKFTCLKNLYIYGSLVNFLLFITQSLGEFQPAEFSGAIYCEPPHSKIYDFSGYMYVTMCSALCSILCNMLCNV